jgi:hypothetical protein
MTFEGMKRLGADAAMAGSRRGAGDVRAGDAGTGGLTLETMSETGWDRFAAGCEGVSQEQLVAFAHGRWPTARLEPVQLSEHGEAVGGALIMIIDLPLGVGRVAMCKNGPVLQSETDAGAPARHRRMLRALVSEYADRRGMVLSLSSRAFPGAVNHAERDQLELGFRPRPTFMYPDRYFVDLRLDDEAQLASLDQKWRYNLRKSFKQGLDFEAGVPSQLDEFDALYRAMSERKRFPDYSAYTSIRSFYAESVEGAEPQLFFVRRQGELLAGAIIFTCGNTASYLYGATNEQALPLRAGYLMHWEIIRWLRDNTAAHWYDLGGTDGFNGLHQFKKGMVGSAGFIVPTPPVMTYASRLPARLAGKLAFTAHSGLQQARHKFRRLRHGLARPDQPRER